MAHKEELPYESPDQAEVERLAWAISTLSEDPRVTPEVAEQSAATFLNARNAVRDGFVRGASDTRPSNPLKFWLSGDAEGRN